MASTYTSSNGIELPATGDQNNTWGVTVDNNMELVDQSLDGFVNISLSASSYTLTVTDGAVSNGRSRVVEFSGSPSGTVAVTVSPANISKVYWIVNNTAQILNVSNGAGATLAIAANTTAPAFCDGNGNVIGLLVGNSSFTNLTATNLTVTGTSTLNTVNADTGVVTLGNPSSGILVNSGSESLTAYINSLIPSLTALPGTLVISNIATAGVSGGSWVIFTFGTTAGTRIRIAIGEGILSTSGASIPIPGGFSLSNLIATATISNVSVIPGDPLQNMSVSVSGGVVTMSASDNSGHQFNPTAAWFAVAWVTGY